MASNRPSHRVSQTEKRRARRGRRQQKSRLKAGLAVLGMGVLAVLIIAGLALPSFGGGASGGRGNTSTQTLADRPTGDAAPGTFISSQGSGHRDTPDGYYTSSPPTSGGWRDQFPEPLFTPTTKAEEGHDQNMTNEQVVDLVGAGLAKQLEEASKTVYRYAHEFARERDVILADTKMEFGLIDGELTLIDELLTPDSSRFWDAAGSGKRSPSARGRLPGHDRQAGPAHRH